ncbi:unnamed protein product, partial [Vitis vinifera]
MPLQILDTTTMYLRYCLDQLFNSSSPRSKHRIPDVTETELLVGFCKLDAL